MSAMLRIGLVGGTFDPFHRGHLEPLLAIYDLAGWSRLVYIPAWMQPFKTGRAISSPYDRFAMAVLGTEGDGRLFVSPVELERGGISYTVDTLRELRSRMPEVSFDWVIGDDNLAKLSEWKSLDEIFDLANFVVLSRRKAGVPEPLRPRVAELARRGAAGAISFAPNERVAISATEVRERVRAGEPIAELVEPRVERYIRRHGLYLDGGSS
jgi:nicotinate-nucleotide adenylyltransferase